MSNHLAHRTLSALAVAAAAGILSVAPAHAMFPLPPDPPGPVLLDPAPGTTVVENGPEVLQIALGALGGVALAAAAAGARSRSRHAPAAHA
jgi:hypothetical protein